MVIMATPRSALAFALLLTASWAAAADPVLQVAADHPIVVAKPGGVAVVLSATASGFTPGTVT